MAECVSCGHALGIGRYCTNCGRPITAQVQTSRGEPVIPPAAVSPPTTPRFPLYADGDPDSHAPDAEEPARTARPEPLPAVPVAAPADPHRDRRRHPGWLPWAAVAVVLVLVAGLGLTLLLGGDDAGRRQVDARPSGEPSTSPTTPEAPADPLEPVDPPEPAGIADVASYASASTAVTAEPNQDVSGNPVAYETLNMLDGDPSTTWRMPGDGTGTEIVVDLERSTKLTRIGLINGYAKTDGEFDWYAGNRRITEVEWVFDDGSTVTQPLLPDQRGAQAIDINPVVTETVRLRLVSVTGPGRGKSRRDYTAISDLTLVGMPA